MLSSFSSYFYGIAISPSNPFTPAPPFSRSDRTLLPVAPAVDPRSCIHPAPSALAVPVSSPHAVDLPSGFVPILDQHRLRSWPGGAIPAHFPLGTSQVQIRRIAQFRRE